MSFGYSNIGASWGTSYNRLRRKKKEKKQLSILYYFLLRNKKSRFDFDDELKIGDVRYDNMT